MYIYVPVNPKIAFCSLVSACHLLHRLNCIKDQIRQTTEKTGWKGNRLGKAKSALQLQYRGGLLYYIMRDAI